jgi:hypothetical protein
METILINKILLSLFPVNGEVITKRNKVKKFFLSFLIMSFFNLLGALNAYAQPPVLFFSDLTNGPSTGNGDGLGSGAIITIWGANLGSTQGSSTVKINNVSTDHVYCWGNADGSTCGTVGTAPMLYNGYQNYQAVSFSIPSSAANGSTTIQVIVNGSASNTLPFTIGQGRICYISSSGHDVTGNCSFSSPLLSLQFSTSANRVGTYTPVAGDIYYAMSGVSQLGNWVIYPGVGTYPGLPIAYVAYPGANILIQSTTSTTGGCGICIYNSSPVAANLVFSKFRIQTAGYGSGTTQQGRNVALEITNYPAICPDGSQQAGGIAGSGISADGVKLLGNFVHDYGCMATTSKLSHTFYITNRSGVAIGAFEYGWNYIHTSYQYGALHSYDEGICGDWTGTILMHDNAVINQAGEGAGFSVACSTTTVTAPMKIYNNIFINVGWDNSTQINGGHVVVFGISGGPLKSNIQIQNNTIYGYGDNLNNTPAAGYVLDIDANGMGCFGGTIDYRNNVAVDTHGFSYNYTNCGTPTLKGNNLWYSTVGTSTNPNIAWDTNPIQANPNLVNPIGGSPNSPVTGGDFSLNSNSPAIDAGICLTVPLDIVGISRPQGLGCDIGAYEYALGGGGGSSPPSFRLPIARVTHARVAR